MLDLVENYFDVVRNAKEFHDKIHDKSIVKKLGLFRHWYYIDEINGFAPSKFIGYKNNTIEEYKTGTCPSQGYMDGRKTVAQLRKWFHLVIDEEFDYYYKKLEEFLYQYDKKPNKKVQLYYKKQF